MRLQLPEVRARLPVFASVLQTAKGLGLALEKPLISIPTTAAIAYNIWDTDKFVCPIMDARRNQVYTGVYCYTDHRLDTVWEQDTMSIEALAEGLNCLDHEVIFLGDGVAVYREKLSTADDSVFLCTGTRQPPESGSRRSTG